MKDTRVPLALAALALFAGGFGLGWVVRGERTGAGEFAGSSSDVGDANQNLATDTPLGDGGAEGDGSVRAVASADGRRGASPGQTGPEGQVAVGGSSTLDPNARMARGGAPGDDGSGAGEATTAARDGGAPGQLNAGSIRDVMAEHRDELGFCFAWQLHSHPNLGGRLIMEFEIDGEGHVSEAQIVDDSLGDETVARCFVNVTRRMEFPAPEGGGTVTVRYPFSLSNTDSGDDDE